MILVVRTWRFARREPIPYLERLLGYMVAGLGHPGGGNRGTITGTFSMPKKARSFVAGLFVLALAASACTESSGQTETPPATDSAGPPTPPPEFVQTVEVLPAGLDDPRCTSRDNVRYSKSLAQTVGDVQFVDYSGPVPQPGAVRPLSTATPPPGGVQATVFVDPVTAPNYCMKVGESIGLRLGGTHDVGEDMIITFGFTTTDGIEVEGSRLIERLGLFTTVSMFDLPAGADGGGVTETIAVRGKRVGTYDLEVFPDWFYADPKGPFEGDDRSSTYHFTLYVLP